MRHNADNAGKARTLMVQGTGSHVGKSLLVAALCRIFAQDGYRVAPFKSQNMALNSFVTREGGEIGRAQAVQAQACGIEPTVDMNPILLKPTTDVGAQVVLHGRPVGHMTVEEYVAFKPRALEAAMESLERLVSCYDIVVLEGAGSPAEVNLKAHDIVNMRMAEAAGAPVILVGDIDRGGVFAWLVGTLDLLEERERKRVRGVVINKFRGRRSLLEPGLEMLKERTGVPVLGVVPYLKDLRVAQEDSLGVPEGNSSHPPKDLLIRVIRLPHLSNFTDFDPLASEVDVDLSYAHSPEEIDRPDLLILPGTKNTLADLVFLWEKGFAPAIHRCLQGGGMLVGICGGFQMLGQKVLDPLGVESPLREAEGLGLLKTTTTFFPEKVTTQVRAIHTETGFEVRGYEIHMGRTEEGRETLPVFRFLERAGETADGPEGLSNREGNVWGTYIHGVFDEGPFRRAFLDGLRRRKGLCPLEKGPTLWDPQGEYDRLAACVRQSLDMAAVYGLLGSET